MDPEIGVSSISIFPTPEKAQVQVKPIPTIYFLTLKNTLPKVGKMSSGIVSEFIRNMS